MLALVRIIYLRARKARAAAQLAPASPPALVE
jgi:hypothetical protein